MNVLDAVIIEVGEIIELKSENKLNFYGYVKVKYDCYGRISDGEVLIKTLADAENVKIGNIIQV